MTGCIGGCTQNGCNAGACDAGNGWFLSGDGSCVRCNTVFGGSCLQCSSSRCTLADSKSYLTVTGVRNCALIIYILHTRLFGAPFDAV